MIAYLQNFEGGAIRSIICEDPAEVLSDLELAAGFVRDTVKVVACRFSRVPQLNELLDQMTAALADIAKAIFPNWYAPARLDTGALMPGASGYALDIDKITAELPKVSDKWLREALACCDAGQMPLPGQYSLEINAFQLKLAIGADKLILVMSIEDTHPSPQHLLGLAKAAEWFARVTDSAVCVLIPERLARYNELESILYDSVAFALRTASAAGIGQPDETKFEYGPIIGSPHPFSPGEQALARQLALDPELGKLFIFNQNVDTVRDNRFMVDLLWPAGKVIVEVDGWSVHGNRYAFGQDRNRDYELVISGYLVLRLTHDEVLRDIGIAVDKIRDLVQYRKNHPINYSEAP